MTMPSTPNAVMQPTQRPVSPEQRRKELKGTIFYSAILAGSVIVLVGIIGWLGWIGLFDLPLLEGGEVAAAPTRVVQQGKALSAQQMGSLIVGRLTAEIQQGSAPYVVRLSEKELTAFFAGFVPQAARTHADVEFAQVVMTKSWAELAVHAHLFRFIHLPLRLRARPAAQSGKLHLDVAEFRLGRLVLGTWASDVLLSTLFTYDPRDIQLQLGRFTLTNIRTADRTLELVFE